MSRELRVMFLDDDTYMLHAYQRMLRGEPFQCVFEQCCDNAGSYLAQHSMDLLLVDYLMPEQNGLEFCQQKDRWYQKPGCYLLSGMQTSPIFEEAVCQGVIQGVLSKPITKAELLTFFQQQRRLRT